MPRTKYDATAMGLHWAIGILMIFMIFFGEDLMGREARSQGTFLPSLHVSIGATILALSIVRLIWRLKNPPPPLPATMAGWEVAVSKITHLLFYVLIIGLPLTGWLAFTPEAAEDPELAGVTLFGLAGVPAAPAIPGAGGLHALGSNVAMALVILHVLAALKHQFYDKDNVLRRMLPL